MDGLQSRFPRQSAHRERGKLKPIQRHPRDGNRHRLEWAGFHLQGMIVDIARNPVTAVVGGGHLILAAVSLHHLAAGALFGRHGRVRDRTCHRRRQKRGQQQSQSAEFAKVRHCR